MTTANLSVGIKTEGAKSALAQLKAELRAMTAEALRIDTSAIETSLRAALKDKTFTAVVSADTVQLGRAINRTLATEFGTARRLNVKLDDFKSELAAAIKYATGAELFLNAKLTPESIQGMVAEVARSIALQKLEVRINQEFLAAQVTQALREGSKGRLEVRANVAAQAPASVGPVPVPFSPAALNAALSQALVPTLDKIAQAVSDGMKSAGAAPAAPGAGGGRTRFTSSLSARRRDGSTVRSTTSLAGEEGEDELRRARFLSGETARLKAWEALQKKSAVDMNAVWEQVERERLTSLNALETQHTDSLKNQIRKRLQDARAARTEGISQAQAYFEQERQIRAQAQARLNNSVTAGKGEISDNRQGELARLRAFEAAQKKSAVDMASVWAQVDKERLASVAAFEQQATTRTKAGLAERTKASREAQQRGLEQARAFYADQERMGVEAAARQKLTMARVYEDAKARAADSFTGRGVQIAAARDLAKQFGNTSASNFLGAKSGLLEEVNTLENFRQKTVGARGAVAEMKTTLNEAHSLARGFAGSLGAIWVTWGSTIPLVAGAAIGATLRDVFKTGKDLEYQMKFVSVLTGEASINMKEFGSVARGALVTPQQAAEGMRALAQNGLSASQALQALPDILNLATAGELNLADAALGATGVMAAFNLQVRDLGRVGDVFAKAAAESNTSVAQMVEAMRQASTVSDQYKVSLEETAASLATLAKRNITGSAAGTAFRNMMSELATPTDKAKRAMQQLGLELYDKSNQLKSFADVMGQLREKTALLNEKGRLAFLNDLFDERGAKAANALLSDFQAYGDILRKVREESDGFAASVTAALATTTEGKLRALVNEFKLTTEDAFRGASDSVKGFIDQLRTVVASEGFKSFVDATTNGILALTRAVTENGLAIGLMLAAWAGARAIAGIVSGLSLAMAGLTTATLTFANVAKFAIPGLGWLTALSALGSLIYQLIPSSNGAAEALLAKKRALDLDTESIIRSREQNAQRLQTIEREIELLYQGKSAIEAKAEAERATARDQVLTRKRQADFDVSEARTALDRTKINPNGPDPTSGAERRAYDAAVQAQKSAQRQLDEFDAAAVASRKAKERSTLADSLEQLRVYNNRARELNSKGKYNFSILDPELTRGMSPDQIASTVKSLQSAVESRLNTYTPVDRKAEAQKRSNYSANLEQVIQNLGREERALQDSFEFQKKLDELKYDTGGYGPYLTQLLTEQRAHDFAAQAIAKEVEAIQALVKVKLDAQRAGTPFTEADETKFRGQVDARADRIADLSRKKTQDQQLAQARVGLADRKRASQGEALLSEVESRFTADLEKLNAKYSTKIEDPISAAGTKAKLDYTLQFRDEIKKLEDSVNEVYRNRSVVMQDLLAAEGEQYDTLSDTLAKLDIELDARREILRVVQETVNKKGGALGGAAAAAEAAARSPEAGWNRFWNEYQAGGESAADTVYKAMKTTTDKMSEGLAEFVAKGKLDFKGLMQSIAAELLRVQSNRLFQQLFTSLFNYVGGGGSGNLSEVNLGGGGAFARGGIMTPSGPMPLRRYAAGGIARSPQLALFGEGSRSEAYVPLPDGRSIPVTMSDGQGGARGQQVVVISPTFTTHVDSSTDRAQVVSLIMQANGESQRQFVEMLQEQGMLR